MSLVDETLDVSASIWSPSPSYCSMSAEAESLVTACSPLSTNLCLFGPCDILRTCLGQPYWLQRDEWRNSTARWRTAPLESKLSNLATDPFKLFAKQKDPLQRHTIWKKNGAEDDLILTSMLVLISLTVFEIRGFKISWKNSPAPNFEEILPRLCCQGKTLNSPLKLTFQTYFDPSQDVLGTSSPWQTFVKYSFFEVSQKTLEIKKIVHNQTCGSFNLQ